MRNHFDWERDLGADLARLRGRLLTQALPPRAEPPPPPPPVPRPLWRRVLTYLKSAAQLSGTRHRTVVLEGEVRRMHEQMRAAVAAVAASVEEARRQVRAEGEQELEALRQWRRDAEAEAGRQKAFTEQRLEQLAEQVRHERAARLADLRPAGKAAKAPPQARQEADALLADRIAGAFYAALEARYRGDRETIVQRLKVYAPDLQAAAERTDARGPFIDLGCGRGEFLQVIGEAGLQARGVDINPVQLQEALDLGLDAVQGDALAYLRALPDESVSGVAAIHVVEHLPFPQLALLMGEVRRVLRPGGLALFETPNPRNLIVGATTFHLDPTHIKPLPSEVMQVLLETVGLDQVEVRPLHPSPTREHMVQEHGLNPHIADLLFGAQDYAVLGVRT